MPPERPLSPDRSRGLARRHVLAGSGALGLGLLSRRYVFLPDRRLDILIDEYTSPASQFLNLDGTLVHVRDQGDPDGQPIVLVHGFAASLHTWEGWVDGLADEYRVITLDLPGFGLTGPNDSHEYGQSVYVDLVDTLADRLELSSFHIGGNSMGGGVSWRYALEYPERVDRLVLVDAAGYQSDDGDDDGPAILGLVDQPVLDRLAQLATPRAMVESLLQSAYGDPSRVTEALIDRYHDLLRRPGNREAIGNLGSISDPDAIDRIGELEHSTLVMWGNLDTWIPPANADRFVSDLPNATKVTYDDLGHVPMEEDPERTVAAVQDFLP